jgi:hypothetical protein
VVDFKEFGAVAHRTSRHQLLVVRLELNLSDRTTLGWVS